MTHAHASKQNESKVNRKLFISRFCSRRTQQLHFFYEAHVPHKKSTYTFNVKLPQTEKYIVALLPSLQIMTNHYFRVTWRD